MWKCLIEASSTKVFESPVTFILFTFARNVSLVPYIKLSCLPGWETATDINRRSGTACLSFWAAAEEEKRGRFSPLFLLSSFTRPAILIQSLARLLTQSAAAAD